MEAKRFEEYHKYGCNFSGKLVVVDYTKDMQNDPKCGVFNSGITFDYLVKAEALVAERGYTVVDELLAIPEYVVEVA